MREVCLLDDPRQVRALGGRLRLPVLRRLARPATCGEIAGELGEGPQKVYYHVKALEDAGLVSRVEERRVRGIMEGVYQAAARTFWLSPALTAAPGTRRRVGGQVNLGFLVALAESLQTDIAALASSGEDVPCLALGLDLRIAEKHRPAFLREVRETIEAVAEKYHAGAAPRRDIRMAVACYPVPGA